MGEYVWLVEQEDHGDYRVVGYYSTRDKADEVARLINRHGRWSKATVVKHDLDPHIEELRAGFIMYHVRMSRNGYVEEVGVEEEICGYDLMRAPHIWKRSSLPAYYGQGLPDLLQATVWAKSPEHAVKIANEIRNRMIANGAWPEEGE